MFTFVLIIMIVHGIICEHGGGNWGYHSEKSFLSPLQWKDLPGTSCGGKRQSPINIVTKNCVHWKELKPVNISKGHGGADVLLKTSATSLYLSFSNNWNISFGGEGCFRAVAMHWHWGSKNGQGSEHTIDGTQYAMEGHLVAFNCHIYKTAADAMHSPSGLYVFSVLYKVGDTNRALAKIEPRMADVGKYRQTSMEEIRPAELLPRDLSSYYRYEGSLTTPPCTENVIWTVFSEIQTLSRDQLVQFRSLKYGPPEIGPMGDNYRPVISLEASTEYIDRVVYVSVNGAGGRVRGLYLVALMILIVRMNMLSL